MTYIPIFIFNYYGDLKPITDAKVCFNDQRTTGTAHCVHSEASVQHK